MSKDAAERWAERKIGRKMIRGPNDSFLFAESEFRKLLAGPSPWRLLFFMMAGVGVAQGLIWLAKVFS